MFPVDPKLIVEPDETIPEDILIFKSLFSLFDGNYREMEWFFENRTFADLALMGSVRNKITEESIPKK